MIWTIYILSSCFLLTFDPTPAPWGFFGHRKINRMAVFTLPPEMLVFYKNHVEFITEHSIDPDKRRYATSHEAVRHYIDIDHWGEYPFDNVPRTWTDALINFSDIYLCSDRDTLLSFQHEDTYRNEGFLQSDNESCLLNYDSLRQIFISEVIPEYYAGSWSISGNLSGLVYGCPVEVDTRLEISDRFSEHGILPFHLLAMFNQLTDAFFHRDAKRVLRLSTEMGHYVADAHVPLHTTENYNGQLSGQLGIHAFWESRIPELFADEEFDFFVGKPTYIDQPRKYFWDIVLESHLLLADVLDLEKNLSKTFPADRQYCFENRMERTVRVPCFEYSEAYHRAMNGMVETRMRDAIQAVASVWYSAWVNAGQPDLSIITNTLEWSENEMKEEADLEKLLQSGKQLGREHNE